jgi:LemA protein
MISPGYIALAVLIVFLAATIVSYNRFVAQRNLIETAWSNIDTELRRRYDLIPNLVETVKGYAAHERAVLEEVTRARSSAQQATGPAGRQAAVEQSLIHALRQLFAVVENYPELKASGSFLELQEELANTEDRIQAARRLYNANVQEYNRRVESFPSNVIAGLGGFSRRDFFQIERALRAEVERAPRADVAASPPPYPA